MSEKFDSIPHNLQAILAEFYKAKHKTCKLIQSHPCKMFFWFNHIKILCTFWIYVLKLTYIRFKIEINLIKMSMILDSVNLVLLTLNMYLNSVPASEEHNLTDNGSVNLVLLTLNMYLNSVPASEEHNLTDNGSVNLRGIGLPQSYRGNALSRSVQTYSQKFIKAYIVQIIN